MSAEEYLKLNIKLSRHKPQRCDLRSLRVLIKKSYTTPTHPIHPTLHVVQNIAKSLILLVGLP